MTDKQPLTLGSIWTCGRDFLKKKGVPDADLDAWLLMEEVWQISRSFFYAHRGDELKKKECQGQLKQYEEYLQRRGQREPLQHILGYAWFMELKFLVNSHVLVPRPDTEILAEEARRRLRPQGRVLDMCTGSGCILLSLLYCCEDAQGLGVDISKEALEVARENSRRLEIPAEFLCSDLFEKVEGKFHMIVSNPPYIPGGQIDSLMEEVSGYDPRLALDGGEDGLDFYRRLIEEGWGCLELDGMMLLEIGSDQGDWVRRRMEDQGYRQVQIIKDLSGLDRVVLGYRG